MTNDAFLRAVLAAPDDDLPRLIYADWCQDNGQPERAEFIWVQIALAGKEGKLTADRRAWNYDSGLCDRDGCDVCPLRRRERELLMPNWSKWWPWVWGDTRYCANLLAGPITGIINDVSIGTFRRGFIESVTCTLADWLTHGPNIVRAAPIREVRLNDMEVREYTQAEYGQLRDSVRQLGEACPEGPFFLLAPRAPIRAFGPVPQSFVTMLLPGFDGWRSKAEGESKTSAACIVWAKAEADDRDAARERQHAWGQALPPVRPSA